ncbi:MAG TPA: HAD hydrolase-like protein, partial [Isosphaeraceae bacterium]|nr:HAD hydrolase-like protein [Isosphaeraceae bacterium]
MPSSDRAWLAIFDHDGVLVDTLKLHQSAWLEYGRRSGLSITAEFIHQTFGMTNPSILRVLPSVTMSEDEMARHSARKEECYREIAEGKIALMDGVRELLDALTDCGVRLAIGSSGVRANLELTVRECGLDGRFAAVAALEDITR